MKLEFDWPGVVLGLGLVRAFRTCSGELGGGQAILQWGHGNMVMAWFYRLLSSPALPFLRRLHQANPPPGQSPKAAWCLVQEFRQYLGLQA